MKKFFSAMLAAAILVCTMMPAAFAEAIPTNTLPTVAGESILYEIETYKDQFYAGSTNVVPGDSTTTDKLSGGAGVNSGGLGYETVTISFPVTVTEDKFYEIETVAGVAAHLSFPYWALDGEKVFTYSTGNGVPCGFEFTTGGNYPAYKHTIPVFLRAGSHTLTFAIPPRVGYGGSVAFALDYVKITATNASVPTVAFADGATATASAGGKVAVITYDNKAVMTQDGVESCAPYYKVDIMPYGARTAPVVASAVFETEKTADGTVAEKHIRHIVMNNLLCGTFYAKVYPLSAASASAGAVGEPIETAPFTIAERPVPANAVRVELDEGWPYDEKFVVDTPFASGGKLLTSNQGIEWCANNQWPRNGETDDIVHTLEVTIPETGTYDIEALLSDPYPAKTFLSEAVIKLNGETILSNYDAKAADMSINGTFPWNSNPMAKYTAQKELQAGTYTLTAEFKAPTGSATQPYLFSADYIQFSPVGADALISGTKVTTVEMEDYVDSFVYDQVDENGVSTGNKPNDAHVQYSGNASDGAYFATDSYATEDLDLDMLVSIPVDVEKTGFYQFELMDSAAGSNGNVKIDGATTIISNISWGTALGSIGEDVMDAVTSKWGYFDAKYHQARRNTTTIYLTAGAHTIDFTYYPRNVHNTTASIDYMKFTPILAPVATVAAAGGVIELDAYATFAVKDNSVQAAKAVAVDHENSANGKLLSLKEEPMVSGATIDIPMSVEKSGWYDVGAILSYKSGQYTSRITLAVDGNDPFLVNTVDNADREDLSNENTYFDKSYPIYRFGGLVYLEAGDHTLNLFAKSREAYASDQQAEEDGGLYRVCFMADNITFTPVDGKAVVDGNNVSVTANFDSTVSGKAILAAYSGYELVGVTLVDLTDAKAVTGTIACESKPNAVKVMVWEDLANAVPVTKVKNITVK